MPSLAKQQFDLIWEETLQDYICAIAWSDIGDQVVVSCANGEIQCLHWPTQETIQVQGETGQSIDTLDFSAGGQFLAAAGQAGRVKIWQMSEGHPQAIDQIECPRIWVDHLLWHPHRQELAIGLGANILIWDANTQQEVTNLAFECSSVLGMDWHPHQSVLAVGGHQGIKIWNGEDWAQDPDFREIPTASMGLSWSNCGQYLASGNLDKTLVVWHLNEPQPWRMSGFPGRVRQLAWSQKTVGSAPLLAVASMDGIVCWQKRDPKKDWQAQVLEGHHQQVNAIAFQPGTTLLASAGADGQVCLWQNAQKLVQRLKGAPQGFSCLAWSPDGQTLVAGGQQGEWKIWSLRQRGRGFS